MSHGSDPSNGWLVGRRVAFVGRLGGVTRRQAVQLVRELGGLPVDGASEQSDLIVIGAEEPSGTHDQLLDEPTRAAVASGAIQLLSETELWQRLGLVDSEQEVRRLYTPAMLAELVGVEVSLIRRWHRSGLIEAVREVQRLPYFEFSDVAVARRLKELTSAGVSTAAIKRMVAELQRRAPHVARPLAELPTVIDGKQLLLWEEDQLIEPSGQRRLDFNASEQGTAAPEKSGRRVLALAVSQAATVDELLAYAAQLDEDEQLGAATEMYRAALAAGGPRADIAFLLAELLYRQGELGAARERYYMAIELDENFVEARANLGCLLAEQGQRDLALAALEGALAHHPEYSDAHYQLARLLDDAGRGDEALTHWRRFVELSPDSPWSDEAHERLGKASEE
ncbi:MAG TPA: tetratricopeptide repeat protein [Pirellulaceae bacterium]|nr:tetratricopeptide repeat protein [Pirellulaceae bacterium]